MSISMLSNAWQPSPAELASFYADGATGSSAPPAAVSTSSSAAQPTSGISFAQIASELQTILLQLQEGGAPAAPPAGSNGAGTATGTGTGTGMSQTASTDPGTGTSSATGEASDTHHHHHHRAGDATQQAGASTAASASGVATNADLANALASLTI